MKNPDFMELCKAFQKMNSFAGVCRECDETAMFFTYYAGHGIIDTQTYAVLDTDGPKWNFKLERFIRILG